MNTSNTAKQTAAIIMQQLGGNRFIAMTGSKNFVYGTKYNNNDYLQIELTRNKIQAKFLRIELNANDTYTMEFIKLRKFEVSTVAKHEDVYCDMLQDIFTSETGLYTSL